MKVVGNKKVRAAVALIASLAFNAFSGLPPAGIPTAMAAGEANFEKPPTREALMNVVDILQNAAADIRSTMMATEYVEPSNDDNAKTLEEGPDTTVFGPKPVIPTTTSTSTPPSGDEFVDEGSANSADHIPSSSVPPTDPFKSFGSKADYGTSFLSRFDILRYATADIRSTMMATEYVEPSNDGNAKTLEEGPATTVFGPKPVIPTTTTSTSTPPSGDEFVDEGSANSADHIPSSSVPPTDPFKSFGSKTDDETSLGRRLNGIISRIYGRYGLQTVFIIPSILFVLAIFALSAFVLIVTALAELFELDQLHASALGMGPLSLIFYTQFWYFIILPEFDKLYIQALYGIISEADDETSFGRYGRYLIDIVASILFRLALIGFAFIVSILIRHAVEAIGKSERLHCISRSTIQIHGGLVYGIFVPLFIALCYYTWQNDFKRVYGVIMMVIILPVQEEPKPTVAQSPDELRAVEIQKCSPLSCILFILHCYSTFMLK